MADTESTPLVSENGADASFQGLEEHLTQCFVNCIARKNAAQRSYNKISNLGNSARNWMGTKKDKETGEVLSTPGLKTDISSKEQRETAIRNALQKVMAMENLADLKVTLTPAANPFLVLKLAIDFLNLVTIAFCPAIEVMSS